LNADAISRQRWVAFDIYDAFTTTRFGGNPAGVVFLDEEMAGWTMQQIAAELAVPTTVFAAMRQPIAFRYFTPIQEISACGHATLAVATALAEQGKWQAAPGGGGDVDGLKRQLIGPAEGVCAHRVDGPRQPAAEAIGRGPGDASHSRLLRERQDRSR
jgi:hypothetical protein